MTLLACSACSGTGWEQLAKLPRWSPMHVRRWRRGDRLAGGDWRWHVVRDYADASVCHLIQVHPLLPGWQVELAAYDADPASDLYSDDMRPRLVRNAEGYLSYWSEPALVRERAVLEWHRSCGLGHERYYVQFAEENVDSELIAWFELWDMQPHGQPFPDVGSSEDDLPGVA